MTTSQAAWLAQAARLFLAARGNDRFVKVRPIGRLLQAWHAARAIAPDTIAAPDIDVDTGLPPWTVWSTLLAEHDIGTELGGAAPSAEVIVGDDARSRLKRREAGARTLATAKALDLEEGRVDVRSLLQDVTFVYPVLDVKNSALLTMTLDRVTSSGLFVRLSADVGVPVKGSTGGNTGIVIDDDRAELNDALIERLSRSIHLPAPAAAVQLAALKGVTVVRLTRGVIGPCHIDGRGKALSAIADGGAMLVMSFEELAHDVKGHSDNDVFAVDDLEKIMRALPEDLRALRAFRDSRVIATAEVAERVRALAAQRNKQTVVTAC